jgi:hypothetical protein
MPRKDELRPGEDRDRDRIPDDADVAESIKDVADAFKTKDGGKSTPNSHSAPESNSQSERRRDSE